MRKIEEKKWWHLVCHIFPTAQSIFHLFCFVGPIFQIFMDIYSLTCSRNKSTSLPPTVLSRMWTKRGLFLKNWFFFFFFFFRARQMVGGRKCKIDSKLLLSICWWKDINFKRFLFIIFRFKNFNLTIVFFWDSILF